MNIKMFLPVLLLIGITAGQIIVIDENVVVTPAQPTTADSIRINLSDLPGCCCSQYIYDSVLQVSDTMIILSFTRNDENCKVCMCPMISIIGETRWLQYKSKPLSAGKYGIYKVQIPYCGPNLPCPYALIAAPVRVGEVTVQPAASIAYQPKNIAHRSIETNRSIKALYDVKGAVIRNSQLKTQRTAGVYFATSADRHTAQIKRMISR